MPEPAAVPARRAILFSTAFYFATYVLIGTLGGAIGPTLGPFASQVGVSLSAIGVILTTRSLGYLAGALSSTRWMDRIRIHRGLAALALIAGAALAALPWARSLGLLVVLVVPLGFAAAGLDVGVSTMLLRTYRDRAAPFISALHFSYGVGGFVAPFLVAAFALGRETSVYPLLTVGLAALAVAYLLLPGATRAPTVTVRKLEVLPGQDSALARSDGAAAASFPNRAGASFFASTSVILLYVGAEIGFASWLFEFVHLQFAAATATVVTGAYWAAFSLSRLVAIFAARRSAPERILATTFTGGLAFALLLALSPRALPFVWIGAVGVGAAVGPIYPNIITAYSHRHELTGRRFGAIAVASCTGSMVFPWLIGRLLDVGGPVVVPAVTALLLVMAAAAAWACFRRPTCPGERVRHKTSRPRT